MKKSLFQPSKHCIPHAETRIDFARAEQLNPTETIRKNIFTEVKRRHTPLKIEDSNPAGHCVF